MSTQVAQKSPKKKLTLAELEFLNQNLDHMGEAELRTWFKDLDTAVVDEEKDNAQEKFMDFVKKVWPSFIEGAHHDEMAEAFERVAKGECKRLIINMPPRHTKSEFASYLLPAWFLGKFPEKKVIQTSHTAELAVGFGRKVRNLVDSDVYKDIFPTVGLQADSKAAGRWATNRGGDYFAIGVGGAVTGKGADVLIIDDPPSCEFLIQSWDTAFLKTQRSDYSACTTWGVFYHPDDTGAEQANIILLNAFKKRMEFPELKQKAFEEWKEWEPDAMIVEAKAAFLSLERWVSLSKSSHLLKVTIK